MASSKFSPILLFLVMTYILEGCSGKRVEINIQTNGKMVLIDSTSVVGELLPYSQHDVSAYYPVFYIGETKDTIRLENDKVTPFNFKAKSYENHEPFTYATKEKLQIQIDTSVHLSYKDIYRSHPRDSVYLRKRKEVDIVRQFQSYPILIYNSSDSLISVGTFCALSDFIRQAKNEKGVWIDIETPTYYMCGTLARDIVIEPKQLLVAKLIRFKGDVRTECRLKFKRWREIKPVYSNTFLDYVDKRQLVQQQQVH